MEGRVFTLISNGSEPGRVAVFEGDAPAETRPYGYGNNYLKIINRSNEGAEPAQAGWMRPGKNFLIMLHVLLRLLSRRDFREAGKNPKRKGTRSTVMRKGKLLSQNTFCRLK